MPGRVAGPYGRSPLGSISVAPLSPVSHAGRSPQRPRPPLHRPLVVSVPVPRLPLLLSHDRDECDGGPRGVAVLRSTWHGGLLRVVESCVPVVFRLQLVPFWLRAYLSCVNAHCVCRPFPLSSTM